MSSRLNSDKDFSCMSVCVCVCVVAQKRLKRTETVTEKAERVGLQLFKFLLFQ